METSTSLAIRCAVIVSDALVFEVGLTQDSGNLIMDRLADALSQEARHTLIDLLADLEMSAGVLWEAPPVLDDEV